MRSGAPTGLWTDAPEFTVRTQERSRISTPGAQPMDRQAGDSASCRWSCPMGGPLPGWVVPHPFLIRRMSSVTWL